MALDTSGRWWTGTEFGDLIQYLRALTAEGYPADEVRQSVCTCGSTTFHLEADREAGCARRVCVACSSSAFIADSAEVWAEAEPEQVRCPCGGRQLELGVAFSKRLNGEVRWVTVGQRCLACGVLASFADWEIDGAPTAHLLTLV